MGEAEVSRFLVACNNDIEAAAQRAARRIRDAINEQTSDFHPDLALLSHQLPLYSRGFDKKGNRLIYLLMRHLDMAGLSALDTQGFMSWLDAHISRVAGNGLFCLIVDLNFSSLFPLSQDDEVYMRKWFEMLMNNHPERLACAYLVHVPFFFSAAVWPQVHRRLGGRTSSKVRLMMTVAELLEFVHQAELPGNLGGKGAELVKEDLFWNLSNRILQQQQHIEEKAQKLPSSQNGNGHHLKKKISLDDAGINEVDGLVEALKRTMAKSELVERETLLGTRELRKRHTQAQKDEKEQVPRSAEEIELCAELAQVLEERDAYIRAVQFARNYIEIDSAEKTEARNRIEIELAMLRRANILLRDELESAFGTSGDLLKGI